MLVAAANRGLCRRFGDWAGTIVPDEVTQELAALVESTGVVPGEAIRYVERKAFRVRKHPRRMAYFGPGMAEFCQREQGRVRVQTATGSLPPVDSPSAPRRIMGVADAEAHRAHRQALERAAIERLDGLAARAGVVEAVCA